jgi:hypothetical protein
VGSSPRLSSCEFPIPTHPTGSVVARLLPRPPVPSSRRARSGKQWPTARPGQALLVLSKVGDSTNDLAVVMSADGPHQ